jgi:hypothetical protein
MYNKQSAHMKNLRLLFLIYAFNCAFGQENAINFLFNKGIITYIDNSINANYTVSFKGDTILQSGDLRNVYMVDSVMIQINKFPIPEEMQNFKYDSISEYKLLIHFRDYEFDYMQKEIYRQEIKCHNDFFNNINSKRFLLWYFKVPDDVNTTNEASSGKDSTIVKELVVDYQIFLAFTANFYVTMINVPVFNNENLLSKIESIKTDIANSIRVYASDININALNNQIDYHINKKPFVINDTIRGIKFIVPFWLNISKTDKYDLVGTFPDIDNISNALILAIFHKSNFDSFESFKDKMLLGKGIEHYEKINSFSDSITRYKVIYKSSDGNPFTCQYVFIYLGDNYGFLNFTATANTYEKNIGRFDEFVESIKIK